MWEMRIKPATRPGCRVALGILASRVVWHEAAFREVILHSGRGKENQLVCSARVLRYMAAGDTVLQGHMLSISGLSFLKYASDDDNDNNNDDDDDLM